jgi:hypothetical protein
MGHGFMPSSEGLNFVSVIPCFIAEWQKKEEIGLFTKPT